MKYEYKFRIGLKDIGIDGGCKNKSILGFLEDTAGFHSDFAGSGIPKLNEENITWVLLEWKVEVISRPKYGEEVVVQTWSKQPKKYYAYRDFRIIDKDGQVLVIATSKWALIDLRLGMIKTIPEDMMSKYQPEDENVFESGEIKKQNELGTYEYSKIFEVSRNYIDVNLHMNNIHFLDFVYDTIPIEEFEKSEFKNLRITYKNEIKYGNVVKSFYGKQDDKCIVVLKDEEESKIYAIIELMR